MLAALLIGGFAVAEALRQQDVPGSSSWIAYFLFTRALSMSVGAALGADRSGPLTVLRRRPQVDVARLVAAVPAAFLSLYAAIWFVGGLRADFLVLNLFGGRFLDSLPAHVSGVLAGYCMFTALFGGGTSSSGAA
jgi:hypothetical protein